MLGSQHRSGVTEDRQLKGVGADLRECEERTLGTQDRGKEIAERSRHTTIPLP